MSSRASLKGETRDHIRLEIMTLLLGPGYPGSNPGFRDDKFFAATKKGTETAPLRRLQFANDPYQYNFLKRSEYLLIHS